MDEAMKSPAANCQETFIKRRMKSHDFLRRRLTNFGLSMIVMGICFPLYYLGLFGGVEGPLNPEKFGARLASIGISKIHVLVLFFSFIVIAITWNWIYNLVTFLIGSRLTCSRLDNEGNLCRAPAKRNKVIHRKTGKVVTQYVCVNGHKRLEAHFHPVKKDTLSHTLWAISLLFCVIVFYTS